MVQPIRNLGQAARLGLLVRVTCSPCDRTGHFLATDLAGFFTWSKSVRSLRFRCERCGRPCAYGLEDPPRRSELMLVWRPVLHPRERKPER
jgi:hypothetical protein